MVVHSCIPFFSTSPLILHNYVFSLHWGTQTSKTEIQTGNPKLQTDIFQSSQTDESYTDILVNDELA